MNTRRRRSRARVTRKAFITALKKKYPECKRDNSQQHELYKGHKVTYGEMDYVGIARLFKHVHGINADINTFIDVGSGRGKLCLYMTSVAKIKKTIGIELVKVRHEDALCLQNKMPGDYAKNAKFINASVFDVDLESELPEDPCVFVWFSNLCFEQNTTNDIFDKLANELPMGSIICCSKIYSESKSTDSKIYSTDKIYSPSKSTDKTDKSTDNKTSLKFVESIPIEMSWSKTSNVYIYKISR
jgi:methyl coenzyme M reductase alpha subunit